MTYVYRNSRLLISDQMKGRKTVTFNKATINNFKCYPSEFVKTFISDTRKEFSSKYENSFLK